MSLIRRNDWEYRVQVRQITTGEWVDVCDPNQDREAVLRYAGDLKQQFHKHDPARLRVERRRVGPWEPA